MALYPQMLKCVYSKNRDTLLLIQHSYQPHKFTIQYSIVHSAVLSMNPIMSFIAFLLSSTGSSLQLAVWPPSTQNVCEAFLCLSRTAPTFLRNTIPAAPLFSRTFLSIPHLCLSNTDFLIIGSKLHILTWNK